MLSVVHAFILMYLCLLGTFNCQIPPKWQTWAQSQMCYYDLKNTLYCNEYCVDNANKYEIITVVFFSGYLTVDTLVCKYLIKSTLKNDFGNYLHHAIGIVGTVQSLVVGRMILTLSCASCMTELSTPFVSLLKLLAMHKKTSGMLYVVNGLLMTSTFALSRCVF